VNGTRTLFWFVGAVILGFTMGCGSVNDPSAGPGLKNSAAGWRIQYSPSMPPDPTLGDRALGTSTSRPTLTIQIAFNKATANL
jgi:hypothetical protein